MRVLAELGVAAHTRDERGRQAIHDAARSGHAETVRALVALKASVAAQVSPLFELSYHELIESSSS